MCAHVSVHAEKQKSISDLLELELEVVGNHLIQALGIELRSSGKATNTLNHRAISLAFFIPLL